MNAAAAVVFAYHTVGVRGLAALLACGFDVRLVVTHADSPQENIWFDSVESLAALHGIPVIKPADPNTRRVVRQIEALRPDWLFSFYYRHLLAVDLLAIARRGAFNLHGSLLPRYRGRAPVNWAILNGETETGASLHRMVSQPDAGDLVDQHAIPILPNDTAQQVFHKVTAAAEVVLMRSLPALRAGTATETPLDLAQGSYFGRRTPADGRIDWRVPAQSIHNLIRAVAPPYPGAFFDVAGQRIAVLGSYFRAEPAHAPVPRLYWQAGLCRADCADGKRLCLTRIAVDGETLDAAAFRSRFGAEIQPDESSPQAVNTSQ